MAPPALASSKNWAKVQASLRSSQMQALRNGQSCDAAKVGPMRRKSHQAMALKGRCTRQRTVSRITPHGTSNGREGASSHPAAEGSKGREHHKNSPKSSADDSGLLDWKNSRSVHSFDDVNDTKSINRAKSESSSGKKYLEKKPSCSSVTDSPQSERSMVFKAEKHAFHCLLALQSMVWTLWYEGYMKRTVDIACGYWYMINMPRTIAFAKPVVFDVFYVISYLLDFALMASQVGDIVKHTQQIRSLQLQLRACVFVKESGGDEGGRSSNLRSSLPTRSSTGTGRSSTIVQRASIDPTRGLQESAGHTGSDERLNSSRSSVVNACRAIPGPFGDMRGSVGRRRSSVAMRDVKEMARVAEKRKRLVLQLQATRRSLRSALLVYTQFIPMDIFLWFVGAESAVPYVRLIRLLHAPRLVHDFHSFIETSQFVSFSVSRYLRISTVFAICNHWLACSFHYFSDSEHAKYFSRAPWVLDRYGEGYQPPKEKNYLWAVYWAVMSLSANHIDIVDTTGLVWEVAVMSVCVVLSTLVFMYVNSNLTSLIIRNTQVLESYRTRLSQVDGYLARNMVSADVSKIVKNHFRMSLDDVEVKDKQLLDQMPHTLRKEVLYDIHLRTIRLVPMFYDCETMLLQHVCSVVKRISVLPNSVLCEQGDVMTEMYFLEGGSLATYADIEPTKEDTTEAAGEEVVVTQVKESQEASSMPEGEDMSVQSGNNSKLPPSTRDTLVPFAPSAEILEEDYHCDSFTDMDSPQFVKSNSVQVAQGKTLVIEKGAQEEEFDPDAHVSLIETAGTAIAAASFIFGLRQNVTVEALRVSTCLVLNKESYISILTHFPEVSHTIRANLKKELKTNGDTALLEEIGKKLVTEESSTSLADIMQACHSGDLHALHKLAENEGTSLLSHQDFAGRSCMHVAAAADNVDVVKWLCENDVPVDKPDLAGNTPLQEALLHGHDRTARLLHEHAATIRWSSAEEGQHLCDVLRRGLIPQLQLLLDCGVAVNSATFDERCALHLAAAEGNVQAVEVLLNAHADPNMKDRWGGTPLRDAVREGHVKVAQMIRDAGGRLAFSQAEEFAEMSARVQNSDGDGISMLVDCGVDVNETDYLGRTALHVAASTGRANMAKLLLSLDAKINKPDMWGHTPMMEAAHAAHGELASMLQEHDAVLGLSQTATFVKLCELTNEGNISGMESLCGWGADVNAAGFDKRTALHLAATQGNMPVVELLIARQADVNALDRWECSPMRAALNSNNGTVALKLLSHGGNHMYTERQAATELCSLAQEGLLEKIKMMLRCGVDANAADHDKRTCLHLAAALGHLPIMIALLEADADVNAKDRWGLSPMMEALRFNQLDAAEFLCQSDGELYYDEEAMASEMIRQVRKGKLDTLKAIVECGADINSASHDFRTCLHVAASEGAITMVEMLIEENADINFKDRWGGTPLRDAVRHEHSQVAQLLHENGGSLGYNDVEAAAELSEHARNGSTDIIRTLIMCDVNVKAMDYDQRTCLHVAAADSGLHIISALLQASADINATDRWGYTPLQEALRQGRTDVMNMLIKAGASLLMDQAWMGFKMCSLAREGKSESLEHMVTCGAEVSITDHDNRTPLHVAASEGNKSCVQVLTRLGANTMAIDKWGNTPMTEANRFGHAWHNSVWGFG